MTHRSALERAVAAFNRGDLDTYLALYGQDIKLHGYTPTPLDGSGARAFYEDIFAAFTDLSLVLDDVICEGDKVVTRYTMTGRHTGSFMGVPASGRNILLPGITILRFADGRCVERWSSADFLGLMTQIGAIPSPAQVE